MKGARRLREIPRSVPRPAPWEVTRHRPAACWWCRMPMEDLPLPPDEPNTVCTRKRCLLLEEEYRAELAKVVEAAA